MKLCKKKYVETIHGDIFIDIRKELIHNIGKEYYTYKVVAYKKCMNIVYKRVWRWQTAWIDYYKYYGEIDKVINEAVQNYEKSVDELKFIKHNEDKWRFI